MMPHDSPISWGDIGLVFNGRQTGTAPAGATEATTVVTHAPGTGGNAGSSAFYLTPPPPEFPLLLAF